MIGMIFVGIQGSRFFFECDVRRVFFDLATTKWGEELFLIALDDMPTLAEREGVDLNFLDAFDCRGRGCVKRDNFFFFLNILQL